MNEPERTMRQAGHARQFLLGGFLLLTIIVLLTVWFSARERQDAAAAQASLLTKDQLANVLSSVRQAESGQRGYLLTGNIAYLQPYQMALAALPGEMQSLNASLGGGGQSVELAGIDRLIVTKLTELAHTIALAQSGNRTAALAIVNSDVGSHIMGQVRILVGDMQAEQSRRFAAGQARDAADGWVLQGATALAVIATVLLAGFAIRENREQTSQLRGAELALLEANAVLEQKVAKRTQTLRESEAALAEANSSLERRVAERSRELERIFSLSTDLLAVIRTSGEFATVSPAWQQMTGWTIADALDRPYIDFVHPDDRQASLAAFADVSAGIPIVNFENRYRRADGSYCWLSWRAVPQIQDGLIYTITRDVTQEKAREERLRQSQKMEVVGQLTGGIAHDFNNLLTIIMGSLELLQRGLADAEPKLRRRAENAMEGAKRAAALTHRLLAFSRQQPLAPKAIDANRLIAGMSDLLHRTLGETIAVEQVAGAGLWPALTDFNQLENAILNLAVNARDAMQDGGHLTIETQNVYLDETYTAGKPDVAPGQYVQVSISDTGCGMDQATLTRVFEPFFTTKPQGEGTGLGLAQVHGFIRQSGGHIAIYSELGHGTTVKLYLPRLRGAAAVHLVAENTGPEPATQGAGETILIVEDEAGVRNFSAEILQELGYLVLTAEDAAQALAMLKQHPAIRLLFTDVVLTGKMNGRQLANEVLQCRPDMIVLFTTGYTRNAIIHHGRLDDGINFIGKPFTAAMLGQTVRRLLDAAVSDPAAVAG